MKNILLIFTLSLTVLACKKNDVGVDLTPEPLVKNLSGEALHTDNLLKLGILKDKDPNFITRHVGDDVTYDLYYGTIDNKLNKPTDDYIRMNKWTITYKYDNYAKANCGTILLWHNAKSIQLNNLSQSKFSSLEFDQWAQVDGNKILELLKNERN